MALAFDDAWQARTNSAPHTQQIDFDDALESCFLHFQDCGWRIACDARVSEDHIEPTESFQCVLNDLIELISIRHARNAGQCAGVTQFASQGCDPPWRDIDQNDGCTSIMEELGTGRTDTAAGPRDKNRLSVEIQTLEIEHVMCFAMLG